MGKRYYNKKYYDGHLKRLHKHDRFTRIKIRRVFELIEPQPGQVIADIGCGVGTMMIHTAAGGATVIGLDYSADAHVRAPQAR